MENEDKVLEDRLRTGDREALAVIFTNHRDRLWRVVNFRMNKKLTTRMDPDDILQESYLAAEKRLEHYAQTDLCAFVWLRMIVVQTMIDLHRKHVGAQQRDVGREIAIDRYKYPQATSASMMIQLAGNLTSPSQAMIKMELLAKIESVIGEMEEIDQEILALRHFEELTNSEVAQVLGIEQKAASIRYFRALKRLKGLLSDLSGIQQVK